MKEHSTETQATGKAAAAVHNETGASPAEENKAPEREEGGNAAAGETAAGTDPAGENKPEKKRRRMSVGEKMTLLWEDKRKTSARLFTALAAASAFVFTFFIFGPFELYLSNNSFFAFSFKYLVIPAVPAGILLAAALTAVLTLLRGKIYNYAVSAVFAFTVAGYLQGNLLNIDHGALDGSEVVWQNYKGAALLNLMVWGILLLIPLALQYFSRRTWKEVVRVVSLVLVGAQAVALVSLLIKMPKGDVSDEGFFTKESIYEVSEEKNVVFFLLDRFDKRYADIQFEKYPELKEEFKGFTYYENLTGSYSRTCPSVAYLLTGVKCDYSIPMPDYFKKAWSEGTFLRDIRNAGYDTKVYSEITYIMQNSEYGREEITNIGSPTHTADPMKILSAMYGLSAYRYFPEMMKPYYRIYTGDISYGFIYGGEGTRNNIYATDDILFRKEFDEKGLSLSDNPRGSFLFYHLQGAHDPFRMDENCKPMEGLEYSETGRHKQIRGNLDTIFQYIKQLKKLGVYDNTTIIISADHARTGYMTELDGERVLALFIKPAGADPDAPMKRSHKQITQDNLRASIISYFGLDPAPYGRTIESIGEEEEMVRYFWMNGGNAEKTKRDVNLITYRITGDANDFSNWEKVSVDPIRYPYYDANR